MIEKKSLSYWFKQKKLIAWYKKPRKIITKNGNHYNWFPDGKINIYYNCVTLNIKKGLGKKTALITIDNQWNEKKITYNDLANYVENLTPIIKKNSKNLRQIMIHGSASLETSVSMLACAKIGVTHSVIFEELHQDAILKRIHLIKPQLIITRTKNKKILKFFQISSKKYNFKLIHLSNNKLLKHIDNFNLDIISKKDSNTKILTSFVKSNQNLFNLFTSGSTGDPKGIIHSSAGYLLYSKYTCIKSFGLKKNSIILCASDAGWINGHTYSLYGPLSIGSTSILLEKPISILNIKKFLEILESFRVTILYLPVTLIRMLKSIQPQLKFRSQNLKVLGSMGEPLAYTVAKWYSGAFVKKNTPIVNTYFQTETGGIIFSPKYNDKLNSKTYGTVGKSINNYLNLNIKKNESIKELKVNKIWPGCMINIINGNEVWKKYWDNNGNFNLFDLGKFDKNSCLIIKGRSDDVINIRGHRIGSEEIESLLISIKNISEVSVVSIKDYIEGSKIIVFLCAKTKNKSKISSQINNTIYKNFGSFALPKQIIFLSSLPKTRSGKIIRRIMRELYENPKKKLNNLSTMINRNIIYEIKEKLLNTKKDF